MRWFSERFSAIARVLLAGAVLSWALPDVHAAVSFGNIMPLGDSITYGSGVPGGYRDRLNTNLKNAGYSFTFVGSRTDNPTPQLTADGQTHQEGYGGYQLQMIADNLEGNPSDLPTPNNGGYWLTGTGGRSPVYPDVVLLHIGTNDIDLGVDVGVGGSDTSHLQTRLRNLIARIVTLRPNAHVIVSTLIPYAVPAKNSQVQTYNEAIKTVIVRDFVADHKHVSYVDNYKNFVDANGNILTPSLLSSDGVHPTQAGYNLMGDTWTAGIKAIAAPKPSTVVLLVTGLIGLLAYAWRKRK